MELIIRSDYRIEENGEPLFIIHEPGKERAGLKFGVGKARLLIEALKQNEDLVMQHVFGLVEAHDIKRDKASTPVKTMTYDGMHLGLFQDGSIKRFHQGDKRTYWRAIPEQLSFITAESFDDPESITPPVDVKPVRSAKPNKVDALQEMVAKQSEQMAALMALLAKQSVNA
jgi:hypothetical protein